MKAILVVDEMPTKCKDCPHSYEGIFCLNAYEPNEAVEGGMMWKETNPQDKPKWCPLKPMPSKKVPVFDPNSASYDEERERSIMNEIVGYNRCIDEILGEIK